MSSKIWSIWRGKVAIFEKKWVLGTESVEPVKLLEKMIYSCQIASIPLDRPCIFSNKISSLLGFFAWLGNALLLYETRLGNSLPLAADTSWYDCPHTFGVYPTANIRTYYWGDKGFLKPKSSGILSHHLVSNYLACHQWQFMPLWAHLQKSYHEHQRCSNISLRNCLEWLSLEPISGIQ